VNLLQHWLNLPAGDSLVLVALSLVFLSVLSAVIGLNILWSYRQALRRRVGEVATGAAETAEEAVSLRYLDRATDVSPVFNRLVKRLVPTDMSTLSTMRQRLVRAGYLRPSAMGIYYLTRVVLGLSAIALAALAAPLLSGRISVGVILLISAGVVGVAFFLPEIWIRLKTRSLQQDYREAFPDALDLLVVCVEAGLGLDAAINRVGQEIGQAHPALATNFMLMSMELRTGRSRDAAMRNLADRMGLDEVRALVTLLLQSEELGTSIADALRIYSDEMRTQRMIVAETKAQALPAKLAIPLGLFVFPTMMIVIMIPVVIRILRVMIKV
jgi:tight adherence protein C